MKRKAYFHIRGTGRVLEREYSEETYTAEVKREHKELIGLANLRHIYGNPDSASTDEYHGVYEQK